MSTVSERYKWPYCVRREANNDDMHSCGGLFNFCFALRLSFIIRARARNDETQREKPPHINHKGRTPKEIVRGTRLLLYRIENIPFSSSSARSPGGTGREVYFDSITREHKSKRFAEKAKQLNIHLPTNEETPATCDYHGNRDGSTVVVLSNHYENYASYVPKIVSRTDRAITTRCHLGHFARTNRR